MIDYQVLRSNRKTLSLQVKQGHVFVRAPYDLDEHFITAFIKKKSAWLKSKINEQNSTIDACCNFTHGAKLFVLGQLVTLHIVFGNINEKITATESVLLTKSENDDNQKILIVKLPLRIQHKELEASQLNVLVKKQIEYYFKQEAHSIILPKVAYYAKLTELEPSSIKIRQYRARWGSCNNKGELSFNYLLMMLPIEVIDYVIVHELCHLRYLNHSKHFWQLVANYFPDYNIAKKWIKTHQSALYWQTPL